MTSVLLLKTPDPGAPALAADFAAAGFEVRGEGDCADLVRETVRAQPDVLVCWAPHPGAELLQAIADLQARQPLPVVFFTDDEDVGTMERALEAGVHEWVVHGYAPARLRAVVQLARTREAQMRQFQGRVTDLTEKLDERKWVEKAKGILMEAQHVSEDKAFQLLRHASMDHNQRVGQLSREVIESARFAWAINHAGQQRMLSQRLVKLYALACSRIESAAVGTLMQDSIRRVEENLARLETDFAAPPYGERVKAARAGWNELRPLLEAAPREGELPALDAKAKAVLAQAEDLVQALEASGVAPRAHVVNVAGGLRWRSQEMAKLGMLQALGGDAAALQAAMDACAAAFDEGLATLGSAPLSTPEIRAMLQRGRAVWGELRSGVAGARNAPARMKLAAASEELLELFDELTEAYEHSMQVLMGT